MRKMSQPPKHQSDEAIDAMSGDAESTVESPVAEPPIAEEEITPEPNPDAPICEEPPQAESCASAVAGPSEGNLTPADSACAAADSGLQPLEEMGSTPSQTAGQGTAEPSELPAASEKEIPSLPPLRRQNLSWPLPLTPIQLQGKFSMLPARRMQTPHIPAQLAGMNLLPHRFRQRKTARIAQKRQCQLMTA